MIFCILKIRFGTFREKRGQRCITGKIPIFLYLNRGIYGYVYIGRWLYMDIQIFIHSEIKHITFNMYQADPNIYTL